MRSSAQSTLVVSAGFAILAFVLLGDLAQAKNRKMTVTNSCSYTIWPALYTSVGPLPSQDTGWEAESGSTISFEVEETWGGRIWGRTTCDFTQDVPEYQMCQTGGCIGGLKCNTTGGTGNSTFSFNVPVAITNSGNCSLSNCPYNLNSASLALFRPLVPPCVLIAPCRQICPDVLQYKGPNNESDTAVGCLTDCGAYPTNTAYCCAGAHNLPSTCPSSAIPHYSWWKENCPIAYAYAYDESSGTALFTCTQGVDYTITFCPGPDLYSTTATLPNGSVITQGQDFGSTAAGTATGGGGGSGGSAAATTSGGSSSTGSSGASTGGGTASETGTSSSAGSTGSASGSTGSSSSGSTGSSGSSDSSGSSGSSDSSDSSGSSGDTPSASSTGSDASSSSSSSSGSTILGMPSTTAYALLAVLVVLVLAAIAFFVYKNNNNEKEHHHHHHESASTGSSDDRSSASDDDDGEKRRHRHGGGDDDDSDDDHELGKLDALALAERRAARRTVYAATEGRRSADRGSRDLVGGSFSGRGQGRRSEVGRLFELGRARGNGSSEDEDEDEDEDDARRGLGNEGRRLLSPVTM
ncbi:hypothetical protein JCM1840_006235 [Sporobolomyces johnsonii]